MAKCDLLDPGPHTDGFDGRIEYILSLASSKKVSWPIVSTSFTKDVNLSLMTMLISHLMRHEGLKYCKHLNCLPCRFRTVLITCEGVDFCATALALGLPLGYVFVFMILSTIMSYRVRKLPSNFQVRTAFCDKLLIQLTSDFDFWSSTSMGYHWESLINLWVMTMS